MQNSCQIGFSQKASMNILGVIPGASWKIVTAKSQGAIYVNLSVLNPIILCVERAALELSANSDLNFLHGIHCGI